MDLRVTQQGVAINEVVFDQMIEQTIDTDFTLPDYCPDISRVLKCRISPRINSRAVNGSTMVIEGSACITIIFADEENVINSYEYIAPFNRSLDTGDSFDYGTVIAKVKPDYINCRAMTSRKLEIHGALTINAKVIVRKTTDVLSDVDSSDIQLKRGNVAATNPMGFSEKYLIIEEELDLGQGQPAIRSLLRSDARAITTDCKIISNKAVVKGELIINALYCPEDSSRPQSLESSILFSQIIDIDGINENCECDTSIEVASLELRPRTGMSGEARSIILCAKLHIAVLAYCNKEIPVLFDAYSTKCEANAKKQDIIFEKIVNQINESYLCKKTLEFSPDAIGSVVDLWCDSDLGTVRSDGNQLIINGTVQICILAYDTQNIPVYFERPVDYEYLYDLENMPTSMKCDPHIKAVASSYTLVGSDRVEARVELAISASVFEVKKIPLLVEIELNENAPKKYDDGTALVIYYAEQGEQVWDIARRYNTSPEHISNLNSLSDDRIEADKMLLIPC